jgi:hypothetical protein
MEIEFFKLFFAAIACVIAYFSYRIASAALDETQQSAYLKLYEVVQKHHSREITDLRATVHRLDETVSKIPKGQTLQSYDSDFHSKISSLANYYESLGMFLQYRWDKFPPEGKSMMIAMLHNSVDKTWPLIEKHKDTIYPKGCPPDWAQSFQWLHKQVENYRSEQVLG